MKKIKTKNFSLKHTLECGQIFRYDLINGFYYVVAGDNVIKLKQKGDYLFFSSNSAAVDKTFIKRFFRLDDNYDKIIKEINKDKHINAAIKKHYGLRLIRQEPFECLMSYICSAASNIPKIKKNLDSLAKCFGKKIVYDGREFYPFPRGFNSLKRIAGCGVGFRKSYIYDTARIINSNKDYFNKLKRLSYEEAKAELKKLPGVADKVADCVLLFSFGFLQAFPVDTWVRKAITQLYFANKKTSDSKIKEFAALHFGSCAGYAQQFLFYNKRKIKV
jgi:N-glycosylase/DNA lyase